MMNWKDNIGTINEVYPGHFRVILDFATNDFLRFIISDEYKFIWVSQHSLKNDLKWNEYSLPLIDNNQNFSVIARNLQFDFAVPTDQFSGIRDKLKSGINLVQVNKLPNYYLNLSKLKDKTRYDLLAKECDYLFEIDIPSATDYGMLTSPNKRWLQSLLDDKNIDWNNLP